MFQLRKGYKVTVTLTPLDADQNPTTVESVPVWSVDSEEFTIAPEADGITAVLSSVGQTVGEEAVLTVVADGVTATEDLQVAAGVVTTASLVFGEQTPIEA